MGNCLSSSTTTTNLSKKVDKVLPIETVFKLPSPLPTWPTGEGFAKGSINLGGLEVCQISSFTKVWATREGGLDNLGATFFEPSALPAGFFMLGCYSQPNNKPQFGWVLTGKDDGNDVLKAPVDYTLVWSSESMKTKQDSNGYIWLPIPSDGYKSVGLMVTNSPEKPPLDKIRVVRSDFTDQCENDMWVWGDDKVSQTSKINIYSLRPSTRGTKALGVCSGTFIAQVDGVASPLSLSCLKNKDFNLSSMPNLNQIQAIIQTYSPLIYLHPDEPFLPSSVTWFFNNGALLYKQGDESNPISINPTGSNLPQGGSNDGTYWLDLPIDEGAKEKVKKGDLQSSNAYFHVKPMLGATFTDVAIWVFYPFNGPARAKVKFINVPLGKIGEHVGDWEHMTLRVSNFNGELWRVYFSEHSGGTWLNASEVEFEGGNKIVSYSSLHGHGFYSKPGLVLQGNTELGIGIRNDTSKSKITMDTGVRFELVSAEYLGSIVVEPPWLNFDRKWGPKISYDTKKELEKVEKLLPGKLKSEFEKLVNGLPNEVFGEEGPLGPKMKNNWSGDEV
ncbi:Vacuolar protein sorting-associated protein 62 [Macleaya cordata]|uniref:Vacuolar protein sorting-associated protein 62 n=1 Tax=Macleaya cordata TaxID=56857 RepID=A0A200RA51_MACCD|nr:Vacuolar protein sorting-associated protein 62 [Macleaya cordata]